MPSCPSVKRSPLWERAGFGSRYIFFKVFWRRGNETFGNRSGDHIDLLNGRRLTDWLSYPRIQLGFSIEGTFSDYHESREIWFWKVI